MQAQEGKRSFLRINSDTTAFIVCFTLSFVLWLLIQLGQSFKRDVQFNVEYVGVPEHKVLVNELPSQFMLQVESNGWDLRGAMMGAQVKALEIDLSAYDDGAEIRSFALKQLFNEHLPSDYEILEMEPSVVLISLADKQQKKVAIQLVNDLQFAPSYDLAGEIQLIPDSIVVSGSPKVLDTLNFIRTRPLNQQQVKASIVGELPLDLPNSAYLSAKRNTIKCIVPVEEFVGTKLTLPVLIVNEPRDMDVMLYPNEAEVQFSAPISVVDDYGPEDFELIMDCARIDLLNSKVGLLELERQPDWIKTAIVNPSSVEYIVYPKQ